MPEPGEKGQAQPGDWDTLVDVSVDPDPGVVIDMEPGEGDQTLIQVHDASPDVVVDSHPVSDAEAQELADEGTPEFVAGSEPLQDFSPELPLEEVHPADVSSENASEQRQAAGRGAPSDELGNGDGPARGERRTPRTWRRDQTLLDATDVAREAAAETARPGTVGEHLGALMIGDRLVLHRFATLDPGYPDWVWEVSLARAPRSKKATVCEVDMVPGGAALLAPKWIPWSDRLEPGDVSRSDVLPYEANDPRLQAGFEQTEEDGADLRTIDEIGYGRSRVLSQEGLDQAAERWYNSPHGPVPGTKPNAMCANCGFLVKMSGSLGTLFGVCANGWSPDDGSVVSLDHTCGAHSETDQPKRRPQWPVVPSRIDDFRLEDVSEELAQ